MSVDTVQPSLRNQAVLPRQDAQDDRNPNSQRDGQPRQSDKEQQNDTDPQPVLNDLGHVTGRTINITA